MPQVQLKKEERRRAPRQARAIATVEAIEAAALELFQEKGYANTSTNMIASRAGVSIGSLYQYFRSKEEIAESLLEQASYRLRALITNIAKIDPSASAEQDCYRALDTYLKFYEENRYVLIDFVKECPFLMDLAESLLPERNPAAHRNLRSKHADFANPAPSAAALFIERNAPFAILRAYIRQSPPDVERTELLNALTNLIVNFEKSEYVDYSSMA